MSKHKKICKYIAKIALLIILTIGVDQILGYLLAYDMDQNTRIAFHEMYTQEDNIDVLLLGSSHCHRSLIPTLLDDSFDKNTFNIGTSAQDLDASYTLLKEVSKNNQLESVYLELYFDIAQLPSHKDRTQLHNAYIITDLLKPSWNKYQYLITASNSTHYINSFILPRRYMNKNISLDIILSNLKTKTSTSYRNYEYIEDDYSAYGGKGFVEYKSTIPEGIVCIGDEYCKISNNIFTGDYKKSLFQIIDYCNKNDIELTLFSSPIPDFRIANIGYDSYIEQMNELLQGTDIPYIDFNLCKEQYLKFDKNTDYMDDHHLNYLGAKKFTTFFGELFANDISLEDQSSNLYMPEKYFYRSYEEKYANLSDDLLGVIITNNENEYHIHPVIVGTLDVTYEIILSNGNFIVEDNNFTLPENYEGEVKLGITINGNDKKVINIESVL